MTLSYAETISCLYQKRVHYRHQSVNSAMGERCRQLKKDVLGYYNQADLMMCILAGEEAPKAKAALAKYRLAEQCLEDFQWMNSKEDTWPKEWKVMVRTQSPFQVVIGICCALYKAKPGSFDRGNNYSFNPSEYVDRYMQNQDKYEPQPPNLQLNWLEKYIVLHRGLCKYIMEDFLEKPVLLPPQCEFDAYMVKPSPMHESCTTLLQLVETWTFAHEWEQQYFVFAEAMYQGDLDIEVYRRRLDSGRPQVIKQAAANQHEEEDESNSDDLCSPMVLLFQIIGENPINNETMCHPLVGALLRMMDDEQRKDELLDRFPEDSAERHAIQLGIDVLTSDQPASKRQRLEEVTGEKTDDNSDASDGDKKPAAIEEGGGGVAERGVDDAQQEGGDKDSPGVAAAAGVASVAVADVDNSTDDDVGVDEGAGDQEDSTQESATDDEEPRDMSPRAKLERRRAQMKLIDTPPCYTDEPADDQVDSPLSKVLRQGPKHYLKQKKIGKALKGRTARYPAAVYVCHCRQCHLNPMTSYNTTIDMDLVKGQLDAKGFIKHDEPIKRTPRNGTPIKRAGAHLAEQGYLKCKRFPVAIRTKSKVLRQTYDIKARKAWEETFKAKVAARKAKEDAAAAAKAEAEAEEAEAEAAEAEAEPAENEDHPEE
jgi:hypothetical protein